MLLFFCCNINSFIFLLSEQKMPDGSWKCEKCNNINYPFRTKCNRQNCGADKPVESKKSPSPTPEENDQVRCAPHLFCFSTSIWKFFWHFATQLDGTMFGILFELFMLKDQRRLQFFPPFSPLLNLFVVGFDFPF